REALRLEMEQGRSVGADRFHTKDTGPATPPHVGWPVSMNLRHGIPGIALVVIASGCARSALIEPSDVTFARATARMERTIAEVDATDASPTERALFVMAEGLYRYRFEAGARGGAAFAAEAAAAVTDFPALQSLAGSLDLADLRVRAVDGAVQVWETLLRRDPHSPLRPLI